MSKMYVFTFSFVAAVVFSMGFSQAKVQTSPGTTKTSQQKVEKPSSMASLPFESWLSAEANNIDIARQDGSSDAKLLSRLQYMEQLVLDRLKLEKFTTSKTILRMQDTWFNYEVDRNQIANSFVRTKRFTSSVFKLLPEEPYLKAQLHQVLAAAYANEDDTDNSKKEYSRALQLLTPLHISVDVQRVSSTIKLADACYSSGENSKAESLYLEALSYDWFKVQSSPTAFQRLRELYIEAGKGLIEVRKNDLEALKEITFWPAAMDELGPILKQAIQQAQANKPTN